jgi:hypothetical protein
VSRFEMGGCHLLVHSLPRIYRDYGSDAWASLFLD